MPFGRPVVPLLNDMSAVSRTFFVGVASKVSSSPGLTRNCSNERYLLVSWNVTIFVFISESCARAASITRVPSASQNINLGFVNLRR